MKPIDPRQFFDLLVPRQSRARPSLPYKSADYDEIVTKWRNAFARKLFASTGAWNIGGFEWHVFTYGYADAITGSAAIDHFHQLNRTSGYIFTHHVRNTPCCLARRLPSHPEILHALSLFPSLVDIYILDANLRWTFVATHEDSFGIGPFFAKSH